MLPDLRERLPGVRLVLAAMGPRMCALAGAEFDGAFFNWMTPEFAAGARAKVEAGAAANGGRDTPPVFGYVRTAVGADAAERLTKEESFYRDLHEGYRNHFDRLDEPVGTVGVAAADADDAQRRLAAYTALDTIVVRGLASATVEAMTALAEAAAPADEAVARSRVGARRPWRSRRARSGAAGRRRNGAPRKRSTTTSPRPEPFRAEAIPGRGAAGRFGRSGSTRAHRPNCRTPARSSARRSGCSAQARGSRSTFASPSP